jgi:predicted kinase
MQRVSISAARQNVRVYVLVTGLPGSGKTTIAAPLAELLDLPVLARDSIKETLWDALGAGDLAWSRRLGAASAEIFWRLADEMRAGVLDNFFHRAFTHRLEALAGPLLEVHCACPAGLALERYQSRQRHPCHFDLSYGVDMFDQWSRSDAGPLALGGPLLEVDTTQPIDLGAIAAWVRQTA